LLIAPIRSVGINNLQQHISVLDLVRRCFAFADQLGELPTLLRRQTHEVFFVKGYPLIDQLKSYHQCYEFATLTKTRY